MQAVTGARPVCLRPLLLQKHPPRPFTARRYLVVGLLMIWPSLPIGPDKSSGQPITVALPTVTALSLGLGLGAESNRSSVCVTASSTTELQGQISL